jgi:adenylosuccinate lyase
MSTNGPNPLTAISPVDGRYRSKTEALSPYFSEFGLIRYRLWVEVEYLITLFAYPLPQLSDADPAKVEKIRGLIDSFDLKGAERIKETERTTNHDVKAVEYYIKEELDRIGLGEFKEFVHFGLTSQDINNTAMPAMLRDALKEVYYPMLDSIISTLTANASEWMNTPLLARTHGQPASPTTMGKEILVYVERLQAQLDQLKAVPITAKFGGATGNFNAHQVAYPDIDWKQFSNDFLKDKLGLQRLNYTTQIDHYDNLAAQLDALKRINTILIDLCQDIWSYISRDYFKQQLKKGEVGSSTMPHKVNPIDFENAEGNFGIANAAFQHLAAKLPVSRLQRDLTDSTVARNIGVPVSHSFIALQSLEKGLGKLIMNEEALSRDLEANWAVVAEAIQTILRRELVDQPYEKLKDLTRVNDQIDAESIKAFIEGLDVSDSVKDELKQITPSNYTGIIS